MTNSTLIKQIQAPFVQTGRPEISTGMEVEIHQKIKEGGKERIQRFKGIVIAIAGKTELEKTITVRRKVGPFGVERVFPIHSPTVSQIDILRQFKVRRKSIKFIKELSGKASRLKEVKQKVAWSATTPKKEKVVKEASVKKETTKKVAAKKTTKK